MLENQYKNTQMKQEIYEYLNKQNRLDHSFNREEVQEIYEKLERKKNQKKEEQQEMSLSPWKNSEHSYISQKQ